MKVKTANLTISLQGFCLKSNLLILINHMIQSQKVPKFSNKINLRILDN